METNFKYATMSLESIMSSIQLILVASSFSAARVARVARVAQNIDCAEINLNYTIAGNLNRQSKTVRVKFNPKL